MSIKYNVALWVYQLCENSDINVMIGFGRNLNIYVCLVLRHYNAYFCKKEESEILGFSPKVALCVCVVSS